MPTLTSLVLLGAIALGQVTDEFPDDAPPIELTVPHVEPAVLRTIAARCSAYIPTGNRTATGTNPRFGTVAVDPSVIPLGSRMSIDRFPGSTFTAEDTGGGVHGAHVDVLLPTYQEAIQFGVRDCRVTILE